MSAPKTKPCNRCHKSFAGDAALQQHIRDAHLKPRHARAPERGEPDDESFASRAVQAEIDHAMGIPNDDFDWLVDPYK